MHCDSDSDDSDSKRREERMRTRPQSFGELVYFEIRDIEGVDDFLSLDLWQVEELKCFYTSEKDLVKAYYQHKVKWERVVRPLDLLGGDEHHRLMILIRHDDGEGYDQIIGRFNTSLAELLDAFKTKSEKDFSSPDGEKVTSFMVTAFDFSRRWT